MEDGSGWQKFSYGPLGEITENIRTFVLYCNYPSYTFKTQYRYDTWNRLKSMTYPDGEVVTYTYDRGGNLKTMYGTKNGVTHNYITNIIYNKFEKKTRMDYGNGVYSQYGYDNLQRMNRLWTFKQSHVTFQNIYYTYDNANNITKIQNTAGSINNMGRNYTNSYTYDNLYRLTSSTNYVNGNPPAGNPYQFAMSYSVGGKILTKAQTATKTINGTTSTINYNNTYSYHTSQPNTLKNTGGTATDLTWDANGNLISRTSTNEYLAWEEENRMSGARNNTNGILCVYDAAGERTLKLTTNITSATVNGVLTIRHTAFLATLYTSPYLVVSGASYTKHYYAGSDRICSKIGGGFPSGTVGAAIVPSAEIENKKDEQAAYMNRVTPLLSSTSSFAAKHTNEPYKIIPGTNLPVLYNLNTPETLRYFYHPDHIGSTSWVTDSAKNGIQYCEYLPYGEPFLDQRSTTWNSRYTFSGKERDGETGYSYFGARYYNSDISIWLSVDPLSDKYPNLTPYAYCANNPVKLVDPNGMEIIIAGDDGSSTTYIPGMKYTGDDKFTKKAIRALNKLSNGKSDIATTMVQNLHESENTFTIKSGEKNTFSANNENAFASLSGLGENDFIANEGSGGTITWNMKGTWQNTMKGFKKNAVMDLAHELVHGLDADQGMLSYEIIDNLKLCEWRACYTANLIRGESRIPYQTYYGGTATGSSIFDLTMVPGTGHRLVKKGSLILPPHSIHK